MKTSLAETRMARRDRSRRGAILLETLLVMPVYLVLIGGIMWIGDLILAKQQLVIADRYGAWNRGNMHRGDDTGFKDEIQNGFFPEAMHPHQKALLLPPGPIKWVRWWDAAYATVYLSMKMPDWTKGWLATTATVHLEDPIPQFVWMRGRDVAGIKSHVVIMRTWRSFQDDYARNWEGKSLGGILSPWSWLVYNEPWPMDMRMMLPMAPMAGEEYTRYPPWVAVSE